MVDSEQYREWLKDDIARRRAWLAQLTKRFEQHYDMMSPSTNLSRMNDLEVWKFRVEIDAWTLDTPIQSVEEET